ncbi:MAG: hypothetical protein AAGF53_01840 [Pseudomonadota bacterium]
MAIEDREAFKEWLHKQSAQTCILVATRIALRMFPIVTRLPNKPVTDIPPHERFVTLTVARSILTAGVAAKFPEAGLRKIAEKAGTDVGLLFFSADTYNIYSSLFSGSEKLTKDDVSSALTAAEAACRGAGTPEDAGMFAAETCNQRGVWIENALTATFKDTEIEFDDLFSRLIWHESREPEALFSLISGYEDTLDSGKEWEFWRRWYQGWLTGNHLPWELQRRVALIEEEFWNSGPRSVADEIARIEERWREEQSLSKDDAAKQSKKLLRSATSVILTTNGLQSLIKMAIAAYKREISNALPEALVPLENLPQILDQIAVVLSGTTAPSEQEQHLAELITLMAYTISELNRRLSSANAEINALKEDIDAGSPKRLFADAFYEKAGEGTAGLITSKVLWGAIISGGVLLLGADAEALTDGLANCFKTVIAPGSPGDGSDIDHLPPLIDT